MGTTERDQIRRYAEVLSESGEIDKINTVWDLFLVSGTSTAFIDRERKQDRLPHGQLWKFE
jgi:hypothetical protein